MGEFYAVHLHAAMDSTHSTHSTGMAGFCTGAEKRGSFSVLGPGPGAFVEGRPVSSKASLVVL